MHYTGQLSEQLVGADILDFSSVYNQDWLVIFIKWKFCFHCESYTTHCYQNAIKMTTTSINFGCNTAVVFSTWKIATDKILNTFHRTHAMVLFVLSSLIWKPSFLTEPAKSTLIQQSYLNWMLADFHGQFVTFTSRPRRIELISLALLSDSCKTMPSAYM